MAMEKLFIPADACYTLVNISFNCAWLKKGHV